MCAFHDTKPENRGQYGRGIQLSKGHYRVRFGRPAVEIGTYDRLEDAQAISELVLREVAKGRSLREVALEVRGKFPRHKPRPFANATGRTPTTALPGEIFGKLTVLGEADRRGSARRRFVRVRCECGTEKEVAAAGLVHKGVKTCGAFSCSTRGETHRRRYGYPTPGGQARNFVYLNYRSNARQRGYPFDITLEQFCGLTQQDCFYCGAPPSNRTRDRNGNGVFTYSGLDRVDPSRGYTTDNVVPCCITCNRAKQDMTRGEFYAWIERVASHLRR